MEGPLRIYIADITDPYLNEQMSRLAIQYILVFPLAQLTDVVPLLGSIWMGKIDLEIWLKK